MCIAMKLKTWPREDYVTATGDDVTHITRDGISISLW